MTKQPLSVTEMFSGIMELLEQAGYAKHALWGNMYGSLRSVVSFYHEKGWMIMTRLSPLSSSRRLKNVTVRAASAGNTIMPRNVPPQNLRCSIQREPSHGSVQKGYPSTGSMRSTAACWKPSFRQGISMKIPNGILHGQCGGISPFFRKKGSLRWTGLP